MKPVFFLRIASVLAFIHGLLHTIGGVFGKPAPGPEQTAVTAMKINHFIVMGSARTFWDFYMGMGLGVSISLTVEAVAFWQLSLLARTDARGLRPICATFAAGYLALAANSYGHFFAGPVIAEILIAICLASAIFTAKPTTALG